MHIVICIIIITFVTITVITHLVWPHQPENPPGRPRAQLNLPLKALMLEAPTACWSSWFHLLITLIEKKYLQQSGVYRNLTNFQECFLIPLCHLRWRTRSTLASTTHYTSLKTSIRSCLYLLSSSVHSFRQSNLSSYVFSSMLLIIFVNLLWTFSISSLYFIWCGFQAVFKMRPNKCFQYGKVSKQRTCSSSFGTYPSRSPLSSASETSAVQNVWQPAITSWPGHFRTHSVRGTCNQFPQQISFS